MQYTRTCSLSASVLTPGIMMMMLAPTARRRRRKSRLGVLPRA